MDALCISAMLLTADQNEKDALVPDPVSHVLSKMAEDDNLSTEQRFERYWSSLKGLSADLECVIFQSNASCSFWNKADYETQRASNKVIR